MCGANPKCSFQMHVDKILSFKLYIVSVHGIIARLYEKNKEKDGSLSCLLISHGGTKPNGDDENNSD